MKLASRTIKLLALGMCTAFVSCVPGSRPLPPPPPPPPAQPPPVMDYFPPPIAREFRAAWIASVNNIDWPSRTGLSTAEQQAELVAILDRSVALNLNALILQVRPATDALYASAIEPWSPYLTGSMGKAPEPLYDPLAFAVAEAHKRGLELHAWFNPFRAKHTSFRGEISSSHISRTHPGLVRSYGRSLWLDPGDPAVHRHSVAVILDVVNRYDVDGVHIDDYFYPYQERDSVTNALLPFPDATTYLMYGGGMPRDDWRRLNVDRFVGELYFAVRAAKPHVKIGVSPFGIWRPGYPQGVTGFDAYASIYADARKWLNSGWLDYFSPQLYWRSDSPGQNYASLLSWWVGENTHGRHIWVGNFTSRTDTVVGPQSWRAAELLHQIELTRAQPGAGGNVHFSMRALMRNRDSVADLLAAGPYTQPALVPASPWLDALPPAMPWLFVSADSASRDPMAHMRPGDAELPWLWRVSTRYGSEWRTVIVPGSTLFFRLTHPAGGMAPSEVWLTAVDRTGNESLPSACPVHDSAHACVVGKLAEDGSPRD
ncbi:MAG: glycoside hydrolase family 10 protein [Gemmatimonadaceae bacterium]